MQKFYIKLFFFVGFCFSAPLFSGRKPKSLTVEESQNCFQNALKKFGGSSKGKSEKEVADFFKGVVDKCYSENMGIFFAIMHSEGSHIAVGHSGKTYVSARSGNVSNIIKQDDCYASSRRTSSAKLHSQKNSYEQCKAYVDVVEPKRVKRK